MLVQELVAAHPKYHLLAPTAARVSICHLGLFIHRIISVVAFSQGPRGGPRATPTLKPSHEPARTFMHAQCPRSFALS